MSSKGGGFQDSYDDLLRQVAGMSDRDLERMLSARGAPSPPAEDQEELLPGTKVEGTVIEMRAGEMLVALGGKDHGVIDLDEFGDDEPPPPGERIHATFERHDPARGIAILSIRGLRKQVTWEDLRRGAIVDGVVTAVNKGGLTLDVKGLRAFLPVSQVERGRVEDLTPYLGKKLRCEVTQIDRSESNIVLSRRTVLEREAEEVRSSTFATLTEGQILRGRVARLTDHGAFVDIGGIDGLIPAAKIRGRKEGEAVAEGQQVQVRIVRIDRERQRVGLDFEEFQSESWSRLIEGYRVGETVTGWVSGRSPDGAVVSIEEGVEGILPAETFHLLPEPPRPGSILKMTIVSIDAAARRIILRPSVKERRD